jgi:hypothetical protein
MLVIDICAAQRAKFSLPLIPRNAPFNGGASMRAMLFWPAACVLQLTNSLSAQTVVLKDGFQFSGTFVEAGSRQVTLKLQDGSRRSLDPDGAQSAVEGGARRHHRRLGVYSRRQGRPER